MRTKIILGFCLALLLGGCSTDNDVEIGSVSLHLQFSHAWDSQELTSNELGLLQYTNENGEEMSIERLRYLISDITLTHKSGATVSLDDYQLIDLEDENSFTLTTGAALVPGDYTNISFRFGFKNEDNADGAYVDLNTANFNVPSSMGGGYHFMQLDGKFINAANIEAPYNFHAIRAVNNANPSNLILTDTSFGVNLGNVTVGGNTTIKVKMDVSAWFKSPHVWDLNALSVNLMPNYDAQLLINQNGFGVFSLIKITQ